MECLNPFCCKKSKKFRTKIGFLKHLEAYESCSFFMQKNNYNLLYNHNNMTDIYNTNCLYHMNIYNTASIQNNKKPCLEGDEFDKKQLNLEYNHKL